jgi:hypothetical protein
LRAEAVFLLETELGAIHVSIKVGPGNKSRELATYQIRDIQEVRGISGNTWPWRPSGPEGWS